MSRVVQSLAVIAAPVPYEDRRALSQAWYSALHLAARTSPAVHRNPPLGGGPLSGAAPRPEWTTVDRPRRRAVPATVAGRAAGVSTGRPPGTEERRTRSSPLAQRLARALVRRAATGAGPLVVHAGATRVALLVRPTAGGTAIVALCPRSARADVEAALREARYALAVRGMRLEPVVRTC